MKVLHINTTSNWGSTGRIAEEIGQYVRKSGGENYIIYGRYCNPSVSQAIKIGNKLDFYSHAIQTRILDNHGLASNIMTYKIVNIIMQINPDIINLHNIHGYYLNYKILFHFLSNFNIPVVWTLHDCWAYTGHCVHYSYIKCYRWQTGCHHCPQKNRYPSSWFIDRSKQNYIDKKNVFTSLKNMVIVPVSNWLEGEVKKSFLNKYPIKVIHNGIDLKTFYPHKVLKKDLGLNDNFLILGVANKWDERKGINDFIHLRKILPQEYNIILIGLSQKQIDELPIGITGIKRTNNIKELAIFYSIANVYINFSVEETFGMTTCESIACGTPVIVYNSTACPEIVSSDTGYVVNPGNFEKIIKIIKEIKNKGKKQYLNACRQRAIQYFNKEDAYNKYLSLYYHLLKS